MSSAPLNPTPVLGSLSPTSVSAGGSALTLTASGSGFVASSLVLWNGSALTTNYVSSSSLTAQVPASDIASVGSASVTIQSPAPGGGTSNALSFSITTPPNPMPTLATLSPSSVSAGGSALTLTASGSGFVASSLVLWNGSALSTTYVSSSSLTAQVPASDIASVGTANITVQTPTPGGGTSNALSFGITAPPNPAPTLAALSPTSVAAGSPALTLTVSGSGFVASSLVLWNGSALTTTYVSSSSLTSQVRASDIASVGTANITVQTPTPGGGTSNALSFTISAVANNLNVIPLKGADLAWDAAHQKLYVAVPSNASSDADTITAVDPVAGSITGSQSLSTSPSGLAISSDDQFLYTVVNGANTIQRLILPTLAPDISWSLGKVSGSSANLLAGEVQVQPGASHTVAVSYGQYGSGYISIFDDAAQRSSVAGSTFSALGSSLQWKADGSALYCTDGQLNDAGYSTNSAALYTVPVTSNGVGTVTTYPAAFHGFTGRLVSDPFTEYVYGSSGEVVNATNGVGVGWFRESRSGVSILPGSLAAVDPALGRYFQLEMVQQMDRSYAYRIDAFDTKQLQLLGTIIIPGANFGPTAFLRWGQAGLAFTSGIGSSSGSLYILDGSFVNPSAAADTTAGTPLLQVPVLTDLSPLTATVGTGALTLSVSGHGFTGQSLVYWNGTALPTTPVSSTQLSAQVPAANLAAAAKAAITASNSGASLPASNALPFSVNDPPATGNQISVFNLGGNNVVWSAATSKLYVSVPGVQGDAGDAIAIVDPAAGTISSTGFLGSEPDRLSLSDGGQYLYVGLDGQNAFAQLAMPNLSVSSFQNLGGQTAFEGPYYALDLRAAPGAPQTTAVTLAQFNLSPSAHGVSIYDGTTPRSVLQSGYYSYSGLEWGATSSVLYAFDQGSPESLLVLNVGSSGAMLSQHYDNIVTPFSNNMHYDAGTGLVYTDGGQAIQPSTGAIAGTYSASGLAVPDSTLNRTFILGQTSAQKGTSNYTIQSFDQGKFSAVGSITIENVVGTPTSFVRWGTNGLAFTTRTGHPWDYIGIGPGQLYVISGSIVK